MPNSVKQLNRDELETGLAQLASPKDDGVLDLIVCRPAIGQREVLATGILDTREGLVGDNWATRGSSKTPDKTSHPEMQVNVMNSRVIQLIAQDRERWQLAGDQLFIDLDLSDGNLPPGTRLSIGSAIIEVTPMPHTGCAKFVERFGVDAMKFVNSPVGRELCLRGINARVMRNGVVRVGDRARKLPS